MNSKQASPVGDLSWLVKTGTEFDSIRKEWDAIAATDLDVPFLCSDFIGPLLRQFGNGRERLVVGMDNDAPVVAAVLSPTRLGAWQTFQPSQLPLGALVAHRGLPIAPVCESLLRALPGWVLQLGVTQVDPCLFERPEDGETFHSLDYIETAWIDLVGDFEAYWGARGKNLKQNMAKQRRKLQADGINTCLDVLTTPEEVASGLRDYAALETAGWKAAGRTAIDLNDAQGRFYAEMLAAFSQHGAARVYRYRFNERPVAVDLCVEAGPVQVVLKTTYDESIKSLSPAFLMRQDVLAMEWPAGRLKRIEFYGKRLEWHQRWTDNVRVLYHLNAHRWAWINRWRKARSAGVAHVPTEVAEPQMPQAQ